MCDLKAYLKTGTQEDLVMEAVNSVRVEGEEVVLRNLFGEEKRVHAEVREVSLAKSRVVLDRR
ncbi:MAG: CooT family nickel-binding protein [Nitrospiraceae bacterium]|nr:CooT family nickel-binding protein [Nitrospiraceae bacterium]